MIKIGIIGMSAGNAHPYSWSSIINGKYDGEAISRLGYPAVAAYLNANQDTLGLPDARVTHVWTQDAGISKSIAASSGIEHVVEKMEDIIGNVDAVILARDDAEFHVEMARPFIEAGVPIFIDKPLAVSQPDLDWFAQQEAAGKFIMSCSSMRYANECRVVKQELTSLGKLELVTAVGKKDWLKYGVHMIEAMFATLDDPKVATVQHTGEKGKDVVHIVFENGLPATIHLFMDISGTFQLTFFGQQAWRMADIKNSYSMFRDNIIEFIRGVKDGRSRLDFAKTVNIINVIIAAEKSREAGGEIIYLK
ncbi:Gfo/Idh/MocA family oxidoreductase [Agriterribacter sp.]|uniref:Gfo/Idh/MocA family protein n=1 Tax=Agriterribacter sp. TaxID=2821509 RepID=UPI002BD083D7|nr:Gfo/Idh/MocA family oxidoreductase [Agriterribacter sp.]HRO46515.1 Gfo/Idh/MocA family oxidoreductase [Agriterribacter sp.]HRQ17556.1 Gfo/Idh/MocA family oxidoreductase [Agriterribacter sp.]